MERHETLSWILDKEIKKTAGLAGILDAAAGEYLDLIEEQRQREIDFIHSIGQKCDSVGWSSLDLNSPDADGVLNAIKEYCAKTGCKARGEYSCGFEETETGWFALKSRYFSNDEWNYIDIEDQDGQRLRISELKAYKIPKNTAALWDGRLPQVTEAFMRACVNNNLPGIDFYWLRDIGRYQAAQYFNAMPEYQVPYIACDRYLDYTEKEDYSYTQEHLKGSPLYKRFLELGGKLPMLSEIFYDLRVTFPDYYPRKEMPDGGFAYVFCDYPSFRRNELLIHKNCADVLLKEGAINKKDVVHALLYDEPPAGYYIQHTQKLPVPAKSYLTQLSKDYERFLQTPRPVRKATEKQALSLLRKAKSERKTEFGKKLPSKTADTLTGRLYEKLIPYYSISDGGYISDEYRFLSYAESLKETENFFVELNKEEFLEAKPDGLVFTQCADGDNVLLGNDGIVKRMSHESPGIIEEWESLAQFFYDCAEP